MPSRRADFHQHLAEVSGEYKATRAALARLRDELRASPDLRYGLDATVFKHLEAADRHLEGTYIVRLFAAFEAALRSFDRSRHDDPGRVVDAGTMIDEIGGKNCKNISSAAREQAHRVRRVRNFWAHESDGDPDAISLDDARSFLQKYLSMLPVDWA